MNIPADKDLLLALLDIYSIPSDRVAGAAFVFDDKNQTFVTVTYAGCKLPNGSKLPREIKTYRTVEVI